MYEIFEHTADMGIRIRAGSLGELFADAARGLFSVMVANLDAVQTVKEASFEIHGDNLEELLHDWLAELLYTFHARRLVLTEFHVQVGPSGRTVGVAVELPHPQIGGGSTTATPSLGPLVLTATARGEPIDPSRHEIEMEVKAITWCGLKVAQIADQWQAEVIVDV